MLHAILGICMFTKNRFPIKNAKFKLLHAMSWAPHRHLAANFVVMNDCRPHVALKRVQCLLPLRARHNRAVASQCPQQPRHLMNRRPCDECLDPFSSDSTATNMQRKNGFTRRDSEGNGKGRTPAPNKLTAKLFGLVAAAAVAGAEPA